MSSGEDVSANLRNYQILSFFNLPFLGWSIKMRTHFNPEIPIWLLGVRYQSVPGSNVSRNQVLENFRQDFSSRIWLTYRRDFKRLPGSMFTSDRGWGCMLRTGQMMLAQAFLNHYLGREWRWNRTQSDKSGMIHRMIIKWFADELTADCPFSVHQLIRIGASVGKKPGDWFGPSSIAHLLKKALAVAAPSNPILNDICIYVANDCTIYIQDVIDLCTAPSLSYKKSDSITRDYGRSLSNRFSLDYGSSTLSHSYFNTMGNGDSDRSLTARRHSAKPIFYGKAMSTINLVDTGNNIVSNNSPTLNNHPQMEFVNNSSSSSSSTSNSTSHNNHHLPSSHKSSKYLPSSSHRSQRPTSLSAVETPREKWKSVVIFVPVRLGTETFNTMYESCIKSLFRLKCCLGIIGGRPRHSLYFIGSTDDKLIYLDPHNDQKAIDPSKTDFPLNSYHCDFPRKLSLDRMDPSCAVGFYCRTRQEFNDLMITLQEIVIPRDHKYTSYPMFNISEGSAFDQKFDYDSSIEKTVRIKHSYLDAFGEVASEFDADEFVMI